MDQGQLSQYRQALLGGPLPGASTNAPAATPELASTFSNIQNLGASSLNGSVARHSTNAYGGAAQSIANQNEADTKLKLEEAQAQADALDKQKKDALDPTKYRQEISPDGGYNFFDPQGNKIDVKQYSGVTGKHITDVLKKSQNPYDLQFVEDYKQVEKLGQVMTSGDKKALEKLYKENPGNGKDKHDEGYIPSLKSQVDHLKYEEIVRDFRKHYPRFFNSTSTPTGTGAFIDSKRPQDLGGGGSNPVSKFLGAIFGG